jgi:hypothetical protein
LNLNECNKLTSFGNLTSVGGDLYLANTLFSKTYTKKEIKQMVKIKGEIYL